MSNSNKSVKVFKKNKDKTSLSKDVLQKLSQEELIEKILQLEAHNLQLKNILQKNSSNNNELVSEGGSKGKKFDFKKVSKRHVFLKFYYFGWDYNGYVTQEDTNNTIEFHLFKALQKCCLIENRESSNYHRCGRTDKGVCAFSQVISIDLRSKLTEPSEGNVSEELPYCAMLNRVLPNNIRCYAWSHVGFDVSARFDCSWRTYKYYFPRANLNIESMLEGAKFLVGTHDFRNLCKMDVGNGVTQFEREIRYIDIRMCSSSLEQISGFQMFEFIIEGKGFLWHQIRCIMSVLLLIGQGRESPVVIKHLLNIKQNPTKPQYSLASYLPLNLYHVDYGDVPVQWNIHEQDLGKILELLQSQWTECSLKSVMTRDMIQDLSKLSNNFQNLDKQAEGLLEGVKSKVYKPLLTRVKCGSLENKINHYVKRRKLEVVDNTAESSSSS